MRLFPNLIHSNLFFFHGGKKNKIKPKGNLGSEGKSTPRSQGPSFPNRCMHRLPIKIQTQFPRFKNVRLKKKKKCKAGGDRHSDTCNRGKSVDSANSRIKTSLLPKQRGGMKSAARLGSEPNAEFGAGRPLSRDSRRTAGAPREKPAPEPGGRRGCGRRKARLRRDAHLSLRSPQGTGFLTWGGALGLTAARGRENPSWFHESQPLGCWNPALAANIPTHPSPPRVAQARGRPRLPAAPLPGWSAPASRSPGH